MRLSNRITRDAMIAAVFAGVALLASTGAAERPKASASNAGICEILAYATPGLQALCVNYCERRDCPNANGRACDKLLANYDRQRRDGDPLMPCLDAEPERPYLGRDPEAPCPGGDSQLPCSPTCRCFTARDVQAHPAELTKCIQYKSEDFLFSAIFSDDQVSGAGATSKFSTDTHDCLYADFTIDPAVLRSGGIMLDFEEAAACRAIVEAEIAARGLVCQPFMQGE